MANETSTMDLPAHVLEYLHGQKTLTLATASPGAVPHAATLTYVDDGSSLFIWIRPDTTTAQHIGQNPIVSFAIDEYSIDLRETKGIQGTGNCQVLLDSVEIDSVVSSFEEKFPPLAGALTSELAFFRITPTRLQFIDNSAPDAGSDKRFLYHRDLVYSIFQDLPQQEVESLEAQLRTIEVGEGEVIVRQGAPADKFFIVVDGEVEVVRESEGKTRLLGTLTRGQFFGEIAILRDTPRNATVRAKTATTLFSMERDIFRGLVAQSMGTTSDFDRVIRQRLEERGQTIVG
jgi:uncharacterized protein YhbP (UPF0306 family)